MQATPPRFGGGAAFDHKAFTLTIFSTNVAETERVLSQVRLKLPTLKQAVVVQKVELSIEQLEKLGVSARHALRKREVDNNGVILDFKSNSVHVMLPELDSAIERGLQDRLAEEAVGGNRHVVLLPRKGKIVDFGCDSRYQLCDPPLRGGVETSDNVDTCTAGFHVRSRTDAKPYVMTAGHCVNTNRRRTAFPDKSDHFIGEPHNRRYDEFYDVGIVSVDNPIG